MSTESLKRTSNVTETPPQVIETTTPSQVIETTRVNVDVLKHRLLVERRKDRFKKTIIFSTIFFSLGALTFLTY